MMSEKDLYPPSPPQHTQEFTCFGIVSCYMLLCHGWARPVYVCIMSVFCFRSVHILAQRLTQTIEMQTPRLLVWRKCLLSFRHSLKESPQLPAYLRCACTQWAKESYKKTCNCRMTFCCFLICRRHLIKTQFWIDTQVTPTSSLELHFQVLLILPTMLQILVCGSGQTVNNNLH